MSLEEKRCPLNHQLRLKMDEKQYKCDGCKEQGYGPRYRCKQCSYNLHKECMFTTTITTDDFFEKCNFEFFSIPPGDKHGKKCNCDACGRVVKGFVYHCKEKGWNLHPCCKNLQTKLDIGGIIFMLDEEEILSKCIWCHKKNPKGNVSGIRGWSYVSKCKRFRFHVGCGKKKQLRNLQGKVKRDDENRSAQVNLEEQLRNAKGKGGRGIRWWKIGQDVGKIILNILVSTFLGQSMSDFSS